MQFPVTKIYKAMGHFRFEHSCKSAKIDDLIWLMPEPDNEYDSNAIKILNKYGDSLGYVPAEENEELIELLTGKYSNYCGKIKNIEIDEDNKSQPIVQIYLATKSQYLPFKQDNSQMLNIESQEEDEFYTYLKGTNTSPDEDGKNGFKKTMFIFALVLIFICLKLADKI
jgi:hypothetical protein